MNPVDLAIVALAGAVVLSIVRAVLGPSTADRALAADLGLYAVVAIIALVSLRTERAEFLDVVLIASLLGFLATIALAALVRRGRR